METKAKRTEESVSLEAKSGGDIPSGLDLTFPSRLRNQDKCESLLSYLIF